VSLSTVLVSAIPVQDDTNTCFAAVKSCQENSKCREALANVDKKCQVTEGQCSANIHSLRECAKIMETFSETSFNPKDRCVCQSNSGESKAKCHDLHKKVYENKCFGSVRFLIKMKQFPAKAHHNKHIPIPTKSTFKFTTTTVKEAEIKEDNQLEEFMAIYEDEIKEETVEEIETIPVVEVIQKETIIGEEPVEQKVTASKSPSTATTTTTKTDKRQTLKTLHRNRDSRLIQITAFICGGLVIMVFIGATIFAAIERLKRNAYVMRKSEALIQNI